MRAGAFTYTDADVVGTHVDKVTPQGTRGWRGYTPYLLGTEVGVVYRFWGCTKKEAAVFDGELFRMYFEDGTDSADPITNHNYQLGGWAWQPYTRTGPEGHPHFEINIDDPGECHYELKFISKGDATQQVTGKVFAEKSGTGGESPTMFEVTVSAPWHVTWSYQCDTVDHFQINDMGLGRTLVDRHAQASYGRFDEYSHDFDGERQLMVQPLSVHCNRWTVTVWQD